MDYQEYETYGFYNSHAINVATGYEGRSYQNHWHTYGEIIRVGEGSPNIYRVNQTNYMLEEGDFVLVWPMEQHEIVDADRKKAVVIQFTSAFVKSLFDFERIMHYYHDIHVISRRHHPELADKLSSLTDEMAAIYNSEGRTRESRCCMLLLQMLVILDDYRYELRPEPSGAGGTVPKETVKKIMEVTDYIKNNLTDEDFSESTIADMAGFSKEYFSKAFKELTGINYNKWLNMIRIDAAIALFPIDSMSLTDIAMQSGFQSIPSFNRVFKSLKGITPSEYRNLNKVQ